MHELLKAGKIFKQLWPWPTAGSRSSPLTVAVAQHPRARIVPCIGARLPRAPGPLGVGSRTRFFALANCYKRSAGRAPALLACLD